MFVTADYVAAVTGADIADATRVGILIDAATKVVSQDARQPAWLTAGASVPEPARIAAAQLVAYALAGAGAGVAGPIRAEQIGDYRVEFAQGAISFGMDPARVRDLYAAWRLGAYQTVTTSPWEPLA
jgi:hypothetical protein